MSRPTFKGIKLIVIVADRDVLRNVLPESLRRDFDMGHTLYRGEMPAVLGDPLNLEQGLSWGAEYHPQTIVVWAVDPEMNLTYERVRALEDHLGLRKHPEILFSPIPQDGDDRTAGIIQRNHGFQQHWDAGLAG